MKMSPRLEPAVLSQSLALANRGLLSEPFRIFAWGGDRLTRPDFERLATRIGIESEQIWH